jgi:hypothetical protein
MSFGNNCSGSSPPSPAGTLLAPVGTGTAAGHAHPAAARKASSGRLAPDGDRASGAGERRRATGVRASPEQHAFSNPASPSVTLARRAGEVPPCAKTLPPEAATPHTHLSPTDLLCSCNRRVQQWTVCETLYTFQLSRTIAAADEPLLCIPTHVPAAIVRAWNE